MNENLNTAKTLIGVVASNLKSLRKRPFTRTYCLDGVMSDAARTLNSAIALIDAENNDASSCCCKCCHCIHQQKEEEQRRMAKIGKQLGENLIVLYDYFNDIRDRPFCKAVPAKVEQAMIDMSELALRLDK